MNRLDPQELRDRLFADRAWSKKSLGQHFLIDQSVLDAVVVAAELQAGEQIVEIGPGMGVLTERLVASGAKVTAFEVDEQMQQVITRDFPEVRLIKGDVLAEAYQVIPEIAPYKVVANIPYQITTPLIKLFLEGGVSVLPERLVLLVQKEVGKRLAAPAATGERGYLSVLVQHYADIEYVRTVPKTSFWPKPAVESAVICLKVRASRGVAPDQERAFLKFVKIAFAHPRKQLKNVLAGIRGVEPAVIATVFDEVGLSQQARAQELSLEQWKALFTHGA